MSVLSLCTFDDSVLRGEMKSVEKITDDLLSLIEDMEESMYAHQGVGLAAPQIGVNKQITVMDCGRKRDGSELICMINPEIQELSGSQEETEGCLSLPGIWSTLDRSEFASVEYLSPEGEIETLEREGLWARCIQHEVDHLRGTLFIDHLEGDKKELAEQRFETLKEWRRQPEERYYDGKTWEEFTNVNSRFAERNRQFYEQCALPDAYRNFFESLEEPHHIFALTELHRFESSFILPVVARIADTNPVLELRIFEVDNNKDLADYYLTYGKGDYPIVSIYDRDFDNETVWGPRPAEAEKELDKVETDRKKIINQTLENYYTRRGVRDVLEEIQERFRSIN